MPPKQFKPNILTFIQPFYQELLTTYYLFANLMLRLGGFTAIIPKSFQHLVLVQHLGWLTGAMVNLSIVLRDLNGVNYCWFNRRN